MEKKKNKKFVLNLNLNKKKFKYFSRYIGMLIKRGNKAKIEAGFLVVLRDLKKKKENILLQNIYEELQIKQDLF